MKTKFLQLLLVSLIGINSNAMAIQVDVKDISNQVVTCDPKSPFLVNEEPGSCIRVPDGTLEVSVKLEANDKPSDLDNIHFVMQDKDQSFQYNTTGYVGWHKTSVNTLVGTTPLTASFQRLPVETNTMIRNIQLGDFATKKGARLFMGLRSNDNAGFKTEQVKQVFEIR